MRYEHEDAEIIAELENEQENEAIVEEYNEME